MLSVPRATRQAAQLVKAGLKTQARYRSGIPKADQSFARRLFYGDIEDKQIFPYPTALDEDARETLQMLVDPVQRFFTEQIDSCKIDLEHKIPDETMEGLKDLGLFGLQIPTEFDGLGLSNTGYARVVEELCMDASVAVTLMAHQSIGLKGILLCGNDSQKAQYLPKLATGEHIAAFVLTEPSAGSDAAGIKTKATPTEDGKHFVINGSKMWISNGGIADVFTVFAKTPNPDGGPDKVTAFIVEKEFGGVIPGKPETKLGIRGSNTVQLTFDGCKVPIENVLGEVGGGFKVAMTILNNGRFGLGAGTAGGMKKMMGYIGEYANERTQFGKPLKDFGLIQKKFSEIAVRAYAMESMAYLTTALIDTTKMDCAVEAAICKVYGSEAMWLTVNECIQIMGGMGFMAGEGAPPYERLMRDTRILLIFEGTNEILRLFIGLTGIQGPGAELSEMAKQMKDPSKMLSLVPDIADRILRKFGLKRPQYDSSSVHSNLSRESSVMQALTGRFGDVTAKVLQTHGKDIINQQLIVARLADIVIDLYGCNAVLSRASRSLNDGIDGAAHEEKLARAFCMEAQARIISNLQALYAGRDHNGDKLIEEISKEFFDNDHTYIPKHPLGV